MSTDVEGCEWHVVENFPIKQWARRMANVALHDTNTVYRYRSVRQQPFLDPCCHR
jgi:hypothetical protein